MSADYEIQKALYVALSGLGLTVYDVAPQNADGGDDGSFPYVTVGTVAISRLDTKNSHGFEFTARVHVRSRSAGMKEAKDIQGQIYTRLHNNTLTITGHNLYLLQYETSDVEQRADGSFHGISEFRGIFE